MTMTANNNVESVSLSENGSLQKSNPPKSGTRQKCSESRKIRKPLMEKKRRARINESLNELKRILLEANGTSNRKEGNRPAKLEKADILELTVRHLQTLHNKSTPIPVPSVAIPIPSVSIPVPVTSSTNSVSDIDEESSSSSTTSSNTFTKESNKSIKNKSTQPILDNPLILNEKMTRILDTMSEESFDMPKNNTYLIPTRLSNGEIAFILKRSDSNKIQTNNIMEIKSDEHLYSETEFYFENNSKRSSHMSDNHNRVYFNDGTIIHPNSNGDNHRVIWRPW